MEFINKLARYEHRRLSNKPQKWYYVYIGRNHACYYNSYKDAVIYCKKINGTKITKVIATATHICEFYNGKVTTYIDFVASSVKGITITVISKTDGTTTTGTSFTKAKKMFNEAVMDANVVWAAITQTNYVETDVWRKTT